VLLKGNSTRTRMSASLVGQAGGNSAGPVHTQNARPASNNLRQAIQNALRTRRNSTFSLSEDFLERYLSSTAMEELLAGRRRLDGAGTTRGGSLQRGRHGAGAATSAQEIAARKLAAEAGRRLVHMAVGSLSSCVSQWGLSGRFMQPLTRPQSAQQTPPQCSRKLNILLLVHSLGGGSSSHPAEPRSAGVPPTKLRKGPWWQRPLLRSRVVAEQLKAQGHHPVILDGARIQEDQARKAVVMAAHENRSLDACICVGLACYDGMNYCSRICHLMGIPVVHDLAEEAGMGHILRQSGSVTDLVLSSSRLMQVAVVAEEMKSMQLPLQHSNYARVGQTPTQAALQRVRRVVVQVLGSETPEEAEGSAAMGTIKQLGDRNGWKVIRGLEEISKVKDHNRHQRAVGSTKAGPLSIGRTALGLGRVQAAVLWPLQPGDVHQACDSSAALFVHFLSAGIPTVAYASPAVIDAAVPRGYPLLATSLAEAAQLLQQVTVNPELRRLASHIGLEIAHKHRPQSAADRLARQICGFKNISVTHSADSRLLHVS